MRALLDQEVVSIDALKDVDVSTTPPADTNVLQFSSTSGKWEPVSGPGGGSGELNTASNINTGGGVGVYDSKVGVDLKFRGINVASTKLTAALNGGTAEVDLDLGTVNLDHIADVDLTTTPPSTNDHLSYDGTDWVPAAPPSGGATLLDDLTDVDTTTNVPTIGDNLVFDGTNWVTNLSQLIRDTDFDGNYVYVGEAQPGVIAANALWRIKRTEFTGDDSQTLYADGNSTFDNVWANRLVLTYV